MDKRTFFFSSAAGTVTASRGLYEKAMDSFSSTKGWNKYSEKLKNPVVFSAFQSVYPMVRLKIVQVLTII